MEKSNSNQFISINRKLVFYVLFVSAVFTTLTIIVNLYFDYKSEENMQDEAITQVEKTSSNTIRQALWNFDDEALKDSILGILSLRYVVSVEVLDQNGETIISKDNKLQEHVKEGGIRSKSFEILKDKDGVPQKIGQLNIKITDYFLMKRIKKKLGIFILTQGIKTLIVSILLLLIFNFFVTGPLKQMMEFCLNYAKKQEDKSSRLKIIRSDNEYHDEFDSLEFSFNEMIDRIQESEDKIESEMEKKENALIKLSQLATLGETAGNIGHEIKNPLAIISTSTELLEMMEKDIFPDDQEKFKKIVEKIKTSTLRIQRITKSLSALCRDHDSVEKMPIQVEEMISEVQSLVQEKLLGKGIPIEIDIKNPEDIIDVNRIQIGQVLLNLLNNSIHAIDGSTDPWVRIHSRSENERVVINVIDSGQGINPEVVDTMFVPFFTTKIVGEGTGLGLSISSKIIESHGGKLSYSPVDGHTAFHIELSKAKS